MKARHPDYLIQFGKNIGETLAIIYKYQPSYLLLLFIMLQILNWLLQVN